MREDIVQRLTALNRRFYALTAIAFAASRGASEPGFMRLLPQVRGRVGDLGCGHGRLARLLPPDCTYIGMDFSTELLTLARREAPALACFVEGDLLSFPWPEVVESGNFDWLFLRAVLHHIPGARNRRAIVRHAAERLVPGGHLVLANWQFLDLPALRRRILPWEEIGLRATDVEPGDYLLDWRRGVTALRYVHWVDEAETRALLHAAGLQVAQLYRDDGRSGSLTLYAVGVKGRGDG